MWNECRICTSITFFIVTPCKCKGSIKHICYECLDKSKEAYGLICRTCKSEYVDTMGFFYLLYLILKHIREDADSSFALHTSVFIVLTLVIFDIMITVCFESLYVIRNDDPGPMHS